ncbi:MAG: hypothetical protein KF782_00620 [Labilithrix sp.]|nr:hypothetical protein [Labilithrix sp.]
MRAREATRAPVPFGPWPHVFAVVGALLGVVAIAGLYGARAIEGRGAFTYALAAALLFLQLAAHGFARRAPILGFEARESLVPSGRTPWYGATFFGFLSLFGLGPAVLLVVEPGPRASAGIFAGVAALGVLASGLTLWQVWPFLRGALRFAGARRLSASSPDGAWGYVDGVAPDLDGPIFDRKTRVFEETSSHPGTLQDARGYVVAHTETTSRLVAVARGESAAEIALTVFGRPARLELGDASVHVAASAYVEPDIPTAHVVVRDRIAPGDGLRMLGRMTRRGGRVVLCADGVDALLVFAAPAGVAPGGALLRRGGSALARPLLPLVVSAIALAFAARLL